MAENNTYTQIHIQMVFAVKFRDGLLKDNFRDELHKYITAIVQNNKHKMIIINSVSDHLHLLIGMRPTQSLSDLVREIKGDSSKWINEKRFLNCRFEWQNGFGAFSYGKSQLESVIKYIENQELHHKKISFREEYLNFLNKFGVDYDEKYIIKDLI